MNNIKFIYLYRDGANFKSWREVIFNNSEKLPISQIENRLVAAFLPDKQFIASQVSIPEAFLFLNEKPTKYDHCYHEFDHIELCNQEPTDSLARSILSFLKVVEENAKQGWKAFDIC